MMKYVKAFKLSIIGTIIVLASFVLDQCHATDFTTALSDLDGKPLLTEQGGQPTTLGDVAATALIIQYKDENPAGLDKVKRWALALRVHAAKDVELTADEVKLIKDLVGKAYGPIVVGQVWAILDPASVK